MIILLYGLSGAGKTTLARHVKQRLDEVGKPTEIMDGDEYRNVVFKELGYTKNDRFENIRRLGFIASKFSKYGIITIISAINPYEQIRQEIARSYPGVKSIFVDCPLDVLIKRDTKGLYSKALLPANHPDKIFNLTGINDQFDIPGAPDLYINTSCKSVEECTESLYNFIVENC